MKRLLAILAIILVLTLLGWSVFYIGEIFTDFLTNGVPSLWKGFLEVVRQLGEAWRGKT